MRIASSPALRVDLLEPRIALAAVVIQLSTLDGENGFRLDPGGPAENLGYSVNAAGDFNGDGLGDAIIGAPAAALADGSMPGGAYLVFGKATGFPATFALGGLDGNDGFRINGSGHLSRTGQAVSGAGDVNGDGFDDLLIGAPAADDTGVAYVVFGSAGPVAPLFDLADLDGSNGFKMRGGMVDDAAGCAVSAAGDINGDGFADVIIGAPGVMANDQYDYGVGSAYVVFGRATGFPMELALEQLGASDGLRIRGEKEYDYAGTSVAGAGDVNGDGFSDVVIGAPGTNDDSGYAPRLVNAAGDKKHAYVVFGHTNAGGELQLSELNGTNGFRLGGEARNDYFGASVSSAGDINGDGFADVIVGAPAGYDEAGPVTSFAYLLFGTARGFPANVNVTGFDGRDGFRIAGARDNDYFGTTVSGAGDLNGDGFDEAIITTDSDGGAAYVIFGKGSNFPPEIGVGNLGAAGLEILLENPGDSRGAAGAIAGDLNGDGIDDLLLGAPAAGAAGAAYVVFGANEPLPPDPPIQPNPPTLIFTDVDGDRVKIKVSNGTLEPADLTLVREGLGARLVRLDLTDSEPGISLRIKAKPHLSGDGSLTGNGLVEVGEIDATGVDLVKVSIDGDLTAISAGSAGPVSINFLDAVSLGTAVSKFPGMTAGLALAGGLGKAVVAGDVVDFTAVIGDGGEGLRKLAIGGKITRSTFDVDGALGVLRAKDDVADSSFAAGADFTKLVVRGTVRVTAFEAGGTLHFARFKAGAEATVLSAGDALGALFVAGDLQSSAVHAGTRLASLVIGGSMIDAIVSAAGVQLPLSAAEAEALGVVTVHGNVVRSVVLAGYDAGRIPVNADAGIGRLLVGGHFLESSIAAGASAGVDGFFGNGDDILIGGGNAAMVAAIASITIKGAALGNGLPGDHFGIVAEEIVSLKLSSALQPLTPGARNDLAGLALGATEDIRAREVG